MFGVADVMDGDQDFLISGPPFAIKLSLVDKVAPPVYSRRVLIFSREIDRRRDAILALKTGLQSTVNEFPILAGQVGISPAGWIVKNGGQALLRIRNIDISYAELQDAGFSETMLKAEDISSVPAITDPEQQWNVFRIQANFIHGGLLLVVSINHTAMDGYGITKVIEALSRNCRVNRSIALSSSKPVLFDRSRLSESKGEADISKLSAYSVIPAIPKLRVVPANIVTATFRFSVQALKALKTAASPAEGWITTHDAVNALCWRTHARGRYKVGVLTEEDTAKFAFPVEFRQLIHPPLPSDYIGNAVLMTKVELPIKILLGPDGLRIAAAKIRAGVKNVDAAYVDNFIAVAKSLDDPRQLKINLMLDDPRTGFGSTSYKSFAHDTLDWDPILGEFKRLRLAYGVTGEGMSIILPVLSDGSWEVTVTLEQELEGRFRADEEWTTYVTQVTPSIESTFQGAVAAKIIPGAAIVASSADGSFSYAKSFGVCSLKDGDASKPFELNALCWMASCTKIMTAVSALQCVERGLFTLDEDVTRLLPELKDIEIQTDSEDPADPSAFCRAKNTITLRHLLTHTSGLAYRKFGDLSLPLVDRCLTPLLFEPGEGFVYGTGTDWAGFMVERVTGISLESYIQQHIGVPLGITSITFHPKTNPDLERRLVDVSFRKEKSGPVEWTPNTVWPLDIVDNSGGSGAYASIVEYQKILHSLTANDGVLLQTKMLDELFRPNMSPLVRAGVKNVLKNETTNNIYGGLPKGTDVSYAIGGMVVLEDLPGRRKKGSLHWGGLLNVFFWIDRTTGISGIYGSQVFPAGDPKCLSLFAEFERKTYEAIRKRCTI